MTHLRRLLPKWSWAYPVDAHHQLVLAAIGVDDVRSLDAAQRWLSTYDIDDARFRDHRLWLAVIARFGQELRDHLAYPRLIGLQRMLWTKSRMAVQEAKASLHSLRRAGIELLLIKGASRLAVDETAGKHRVACDIDVVVRPECMVPAFDILVAENWNPSPGTSPQYLREHLASTRGINMFRGHFGDIDLHSRPFHPGQGSEAEDCELWDTAQSAAFAGTSVLVPRCEDRIALAIAHGGLDGHTHSDWLVDSAMILRTEKCDWQRLQNVIQSRKLAVPAAVTFHYLQERLGFEIPSDFLQQLARAAHHHPLRLVSGLIQVRPKDRVGPLGSVLRGFVKLHRKTIGTRRLPARVKDRELAVRRVAGNTSSAAGSFVDSYRLETPPESPRNGTLAVDIVLDVQAPAMRRRIEMEINSGDAHLCRIRFRHWAGKKRPLRLRLSGTINSLVAGETLELVSRPGKQLRNHAGASERERYDRLPFRVISCRLG